MRRTLRIDIEIQDDPALTWVSPPDKALDRLTDAVADYVAREWNVNVTASVVYDSDGDPNYQKAHNED